MVSYFDEYQDQATTYVYYRALKKNSVSSTEVFQFVLPYNLSSETDTISKSVNRSSTKQINLKNKKIGQEFYAFPRTSTKSAYYLRRLEFTSNYGITRKTVAKTRAKKTKTKTVKSYHINPLSLDLYFEDVSFIYHLVIKEGSIVDQNTKYPPGSALLIASVIASIVVPHLTSYLFQTYSGNPTIFTKVKKNEKIHSKTFFHCSRLFTIAYPLSLAAMVKFVGSLLSLIHCRALFWTAVFLFISWFCSVITLLFLGFTQKVKSQAYKWLMFLLCLDWVVAV